MMFEVNKKNRIELKFEELRRRKEKALIPFITAGDPSLAATAELVLAMEKAGGDVIELGIPYSDPIADGPVIQESSARALANGAKITRIMEMVQEIRKSSKVPLIYLVYYNSIFRYGIERFIKECSSSGIDGIIIPDLPIEERSELLNLALEYGVFLIPLVAPTSKDRIKLITENGKGFVYCVSTNGVTGARNNLAPDLAAYLQLVSEYTGMPRALGFGISSPHMAKEYKDYCEAIIVGSALVRKIADAANENDAVKIAGAFVSELKEAIK